MISKNQIAPQIAANSIGGYPVDTFKLRGKKVLIKFHRFSGCPVAQRQIGEYTQRQNELTDAGVETIVFIHNSENKITPVNKEVPGLHIIADKEKVFYKMFQSRFQFSKLFSIASWVSTFQSFFKGYFPKFNRFGGGITAVPSDFLLNEKGEVTDFHYGRHFGDSWSVSEVLNKVKQNEN